VVTRAMRSIKTVDLPQSPKPAKKVILAPRMRPHHSHVGSSVTTAWASNMFTAT